jgi:hypothetical protein
MKMHAAEIESESDHSPNFKNPIFVVDDIPTDENYHGTMDENKKTKFRAIHDSLLNSNFDKMTANEGVSPVGLRINDLKQGENPSPIGLHGMMEKKSNMINVTGAARKEVDWKFDLNSSPVLNVKTNSFDL